MPCYIPFMNITFRPTQLAETSVLPDIERCAGQRFRHVAELAWIADAPVISAEEHQEYVAAGMSWLALADDRPIGFLLAQAQGSSLFIAEISLDLAWQGKGVGRRLIEYVSQQARERSFTALTLTTFRDVPWNAPFYAHLGFEVLPDKTLCAALRQKREEEAAHGLAYDLRCAMRLTLN